MSEKWTHFSKRELCDIHHACDMLLRRDDLPAGERLPLQTLAAEAWAEHCRRLSTPKKIGTTIRGVDIALAVLWQSTPILLIGFFVFIVLRLT